MDIPLEKQKEAMDRLLEWGYVKAIITTSGDIDYVVSPEVLQRIKNGELEKVQSEIFKLSQEKKVENKNKN